MKQSGWNYGWFGAQLGGTAWMLGLALASPPLLSLVPVSGIVVFVLINAIGLYMWRKQSHLDQHVCIQILIGIIGLGTFGLLVLMDAADSLGRWEPRLQNPKHAYLVLAVFPVVSAWIHLMNRRSTQEDVANKTSISHDSESARGHD